MMNGKGSEMDMTFEKYRLLTAAPQTADFTLIRFCRDATGENHEYRLTGFSQQMLADGLDGSVLKASMFDGLNADQIVAALRRNGFTAEAVELTSEYRAAWIHHQHEFREKAALFCSDLYKALDMKSLPGKTGMEICNSAWRNNKNHGFEAVFEAAKMAKMVAVEAARNQHISRVAGAGALFEMSHA
ncbi:TPA: hypothetical protein ACSCYS_003518 [Aeromonas veronii]